MRIRGSRFGYVLVVFCIVTIRFIQAQDTNLVYNPGFEEYDDCPQDYTPMDLSHKLIPYWTYPTHATPDYFNRCSSGIVAVPSNFAGQSEPKDGDAYAGAILSGTSESYREYLQGELKTPLEAGQQYCVTFYFRLASYSQIAVDQLSLLFSEEEIAVEGKNALGGTPQIQNQDGLFLDNIEQWQQVCRVYVANGKEKFFTLGNFKDYNNTNYVIVDKNIVNLRNKAYAYYFFDKVDIRPLLNCNDCPCVQQDFEVALQDTFYTGGYNAMTGKVERIIDDGRISLAVFGGTPPYEVTWSNGAKGMRLNDLSGGVYTWMAKDKYNCRASGTVVFTQPKIEKDEFVDPLKNIEEGAAIVLENIFFEFGKTALLPESYSELDHVAEFLKENDISKIEISGHTDSEGSDSYNQKLSEGRAQSVVSYLKEKGVNPDSMVAVGYGESRPIETNTLEAGRAENRRVEFRIIKK